MSVVFRPLKWPPDIPRTPPSALQSSKQFRMSLRKALDELELEVGRWPNDAVIQIDVDISRVSGRPLASSSLRGRDVAVIVRVEDPDDGEPLRVPMESYDSVLGNLRGAALTLKSIRDIRRHGAHVGKAATMGFRALPSAERMTPQQARTLLRLGDNANESDVRSSWRRTRLNLEHDQSMTAEARGEAMRMCDEARSVLTELLTEGAAP